MLTLFGFGLHGWIKPLIRYNLVLQGRQGQAGGSAMSNMADSDTLECSASAGCGAIELVLTPKAKDLGGFQVRRSLPSVQRKMVGPWIFFDHMGPARFEPGPGIDVRPHPHIGLATVTYLFEGEMLHRDSLGTCQPIRPGDINLMVCGRGIVHSERERPEMTNSARTIHGLQLWLALPEHQEEIEPAFYHYGSDDIPAIDVDGVSTRVMIGSAFGVTSPVKIFADTLYVEAHLQAGQRLRLPRAEERAVYVARGALKARATDIAEYSLAIIGDEDVVVEAVTESRIALIGGERMSKRYIDWNFVSTDKARITQAREDWKTGRFPKVPGDEDEFIPLPG